MINVLVHKYNHVGLYLFIVIILFLSTSLTLKAEELDYTVSRIGNSFSGADNKWVQNFLVHIDYIFY